MCVHVMGFTDETAGNSRLGLGRAHETLPGANGNEGKKIGWKDGVSAIWSILRFNLWDC